MDNSTEIVHSELAGESNYYSETQQVFTTSTPNGTRVRNVTYVLSRQSTDSGIDNPFRPEGELSQEAEEIVKAIREGRSIEFKEGDEGFPRQKNGKVEKDGAPKLESAARKAPQKEGVQPGVVSVQRGKVALSSDAQQAEEVVLRKKGKCRCCVIQ